MRRLPRAACLALAAGLLALGVLAARALRELRVEGADAGDVVMALPERVGEWRGEDLLYCQSDQCARSFLAGELGGRMECPACGHPVGLMALGERTLLPRDTTLARKSYRLGDVAMTVTIVLSGGEHRSIHRPQQCLPAQGYVIEAGSTAGVALDGRGPLAVMFVKARRGERAEGGDPRRLVLAYWFAGGGREVAGHFQRLWWMAWDNLVKGVRARWAYVSIQTYDAGPAGEAEERISSFIRLLHPLVRRVPAQ